MNTSQGQHSKIFKVKPFPDGITPTAQLEQWGYWRDNFEMAVERGGGMTQREMAVELSLHVGEEVRKIISAKKMLANRRDVAPSFEFYDELVKRIEEYFTSLTDEAVDVTLFDEIKQTENESIMQFELRLQMLAKRIKVSNSAIIRKRLLQGMADRELADRAYIEGVPHNEVVKMGTRKEALRKCQPQSGFPWTQPRPAPIIAAVEESSHRNESFPRRYDGSSRRHEGKWSHDTQQRREQRPAPYNKAQVKKRIPRPDECKNCGIKHGSRACPAAEKACNGCGKIGHFEYVCRAGDGKENRQRQREVRNVYDDEEIEEVR